MRKSVALQRSIKLNRRIQFDLPRHLIHLQAAPSSCLYTNSFINIRCSQLLLVENQRNSIHTEAQSLRPTMATPTATTSSNPTVPTTATSAPQATSEALVISAKRSAAYHAVDTHYPSTPVDFVGIGSGSTVVFVVERISQLPKSQTANTYFIPTGFQSKQLLLRAGLKVAEIDLLPPHVKISVCFDGADEIDHQLNCIKGGGACLFQEKLVAVSSNEFICVADFRKISKNLLTPSTWESGVPIEVLPMSYMHVSSQLVSKLGATATVLRSGGKAKAGPCVTDNGNFIIDAKWPTLLGNNVDEVQTLAEGIKKIVGVVDHGLFYGGSHGWAGRPMKAYFGMEDGGVRSLGPEGFVEVLKEGAA